MPKNKTQWTGKFRTVAGLRADHFSFKVNSDIPAPTYMSHEIHLVLARDLYPERLPGDEPEQLEVIPWRLDALHELALREDCSEGRSLAAIFLVRELLRMGLPA